ncbi:polysaccharide deacetylase family protein [Bradyrhizobium lablabi]|uniref:polysaccharide deacetylase family protein n=1 Tax=Bradyrhizobium lablabi TaxID=722472 RepID=UPI001560DA00|nr:polysaccharide deacetylase family protein [Bradyrhizobium lablabi]
MRLQFLGGGFRTILFHHLFFPGEARDHSRDRLKFQCDWLCSNFHPVTLRQAQTAFANGSLPPKAILITIDDAKIDILSALDVFASFSLPICIFPCVGWCAQEVEVAHDPRVALAKLVADLEWYRGPAVNLEIAGQTVVVGADAPQTARAIDYVLTAAFNGNFTFQRPLSFPRKNTRSCCSLDELTDIACESVAIGAHSVSHVNLAHAGPLRREYEIRASREILFDAIGECAAFAYPYGMQGTHSDKTEQIIREAGFELAFLSHSDLIEQTTNIFQLPRISLPNRPISKIEFCTRVAGAGITFRKFKQAFGGALICSRSF